MNLSIISGRMAKDPEVRYTNSGKAVCPFVVAVNEGKDKAQFVPCVAFDTDYHKNATNISKYFDKGSPITLTGHLSCRTWEKDGTKRYAWEVFVDRFEFVPGNTRKAEATPDAFAEIEDDAELPF